MKMQCKSIPAELSFSPSVSMRWYEELGNAAGRHDAMNGLKSDAEVPKQ